MINSDVSHAFYSLSKKLIMQYCIHHPLLMMLHLKSLN